MQNRVRLLSCSLLALGIAACSPAPQPAEDAAATAPAPASAAPVAAPAADGAAAARLENIAIHEPWLRQPPPSARVAAGYLRIDNAGPEADRLVAVETAAAERVEIHEMEHVDGLMRMREMAAGLEVPPGGVALEPGGYHLMLMGARPDLQAGQEIEGVLVFERAGRLAVTFEVRPPDAGAGSHGGEHPQGH